MLMMQVDGCKADLIPCALASFGSVCQLGECDSRVYRCHGLIALLFCLPFDTHCCRTGTAIKHPLPDRVKQSFVIFDIRALWRSALSVRVPRCQKLQMMA